MLIRILDNSGRIFVGSLVLIILVMLGGLIILIYSNAIKEGPLTREENSNAAETRAESDPRRLKIRGLGQDEQLLLSKVREDVQALEGTVELCKRDNVEEIRCSKWESSYIVKGSQDYLSDLASLDRKQNRDYIEWYRETRAENYDSHPQITQVITFRPTTFYPEVRPLMGIAMALVIVLILVSGTTASIWDYIRRRRRYQTRSRA